MEIHIKDICQILEELITTGNPYDFYLFGQRIYEKLTSIGNNRISGMWYAVPIEEQINYLLKEKFLE